MTRKSTHIARTYSIATRAQLVGVIYSGEDHCLAVLIYSFPVMHLKEGAGKWRVRGKDRRPNRRALQLLLPAVQRPVEPQVFVHESVAIQVISSIHPNVVVRIQPPN